MCAEDQLSIIMCNNSAIVSAMKQRRYTYIRKAIAFIRVVQSINSFMSHCQFCRKELSENRFKLKQIREI